MCTFGPTSTFTLELFGNGIAEVNANAYPSLLLSKSFMNAGVSSLGANEADIILLLPTAVNNVSNPSLTQKVSS